MGREILQHHEAWVKKSGVRANDRSVYEHQVICAALSHMVNYDQINVCALASAEYLNRRRTLIEFAHSGSPESPSYEAAEDVMGSAEAADGSVVDPALTRYVAKRQQGKAEVMKQQRMAAEEKRAAQHRPAPKKGVAKGGEAPP